MRLALGGETIEKDDDVSQYLDADDYTYRVDSDFVQKCADMIIEHMKPIMENLDEMEKNFLKLWSADRKIEKRKERADEVKKNTLKMWDKHCV